MKFVCDRCGKRYASTDEPVPGRLYRIPCKCGHVILVRGDAAGGVMPAGPATAPAEARSPPAAPAPRPAPAAPAPFASPGVRPSPSGRPRPAAGGEVPQFDGDPFAAAVAPPAHPAATSAADLGGPGAWPDVRAKAPEPRDPAIRLEEPTPPSLRQPYPEPRSFDGPGGGLELEPLAGGPGQAPEVPAPDDPFGPAASLGAQPAPSPEVPRPSFARPSSLAPPPFARIDRGAGAHAQSADLGASASIAARLRRKRSRRGLLIAVVVGVVAAAAVGAWLFVISRGSTSTTTATVDVAAEAPRGASPAAAPSPETKPPPETAPTRKSHTPGARRDSQ